MWTPPGPGPVGGTVEWTKVRLQSQCLTIRVGLSYLDVLICLDSSHFLKETRGGGKKWRSLVEMGDSPPNLGREMQKHLWMLPGWHAFLQLSNFGLEAANRLLNSLGLAPRTSRDVQHNGTWRKNDLPHIFPYFSGELPQGVFKRILVWPLVCVRVSWVRRERVALPVLPISPAMVAFLSKPWSLAEGCGTSSTI